MRIATFEQLPTRTANAQRQTEQIVLVPLRGRSWKEISSDLTTRADRRLEYGLLYRKSTKTV
jgi:hypothetical protein